MFISCSGLARRRLPFILGKNRNSGVILWRCFHILSNLEAGSDTSGQKVAAEAADWLLSAPRWRDEHVKTDVSARSDEICVSLSETVKRQNER